jgi:nucleoid DNA-binding protein
MLNPKKANDLYKEAADELGMSESDVSDIVSFYWSSLRKKMENMDDAYILIENFGTFYVRLKNLQQEIEKNQIYLKGINPKNYDKYPFYKVATHRLTKFNGLKEQILKELQKKKELKTKRYGKDISGGMETKGTDS